MIQRKFRNYEVSLWTLQDDFLIVLKYAHLEHNGQIQEPELVLNIDGTQEFTFTIPMYIRENGEKKENPIWYNYINGNLIASLRKIKVIINKNEENEKILEFLITSVTERHEKEELYCDVKCEGLAFHELGKTGYKISLSSDDFYEEDRVWFENDGLIILLQPISVQAASGETITLSCVAQNATSYQWQNKLKTSTSDEWNNSGLSGNNTRSIHIQATAARYNYLWRCKITGQDQQEIYTDVVTINSGSAANNPDRSSLEQHIIDNAINWSEEGPRATLQYWCNKFLEPYPTGTNVYCSPNKWYYKLEMDWSSLKEVVPSDKDKVYEEDYVSSWDVVGDQLIPRDTQQAKEKERLVDLEESNKYNLTQDLARTFGVYCRYEYVHDANYHITGRNVVFYNNFYTESNNVLDIDYKYDSTSISRIMDGTDLVTKMYVRPVDTGIGETGLITIINSDANPSKEDYLLNFDYLYSIGAIDEDLYKEVRVYEKDMAAINMQLIPLEPIITTLVTELPGIEAKKTVAQDAISLDQERIKAAKEFIEHLTNDEGVLYVTSNYPDTCVLLADSEKEANYYHILISKQGVKSSTIRVFLNYNFQHQDGEEPLTNELSSFSIDYDEDGNVSGLSNIYLTDIMMPVTHCVYLTYTYEPNDHYKQTRDTWERRLSKDEQDLRRLTAEYEQKTSELQIAQTKYDQLVIEKQNRVHDFERLMGAALREGYWQPEDYNDYGDKYKDQFDLTKSGDLGESGHSKFVWEPATETINNSTTQVNYFFGEQLNYYELGINQTKTYYPLILLDGQQLSNIQQHLDNLSFIFSDESVTNNYPQHYRVMALGSECQLIFVKNNDNNVVQAAIILTGIEHLIPAPTQNNDGPILYTFNNACLGQLTTSYNPNTNAVQVNIKKYADNLTVTQTGASKYTVVYPRIIIDSLNVKDSEDQLLLKYQNTSLSQYADYSITTRVKESSSEFCITLKPTTLVGRGTIKGTLDVAFSISNANTSIYLDAIQVLRDSSRPQVSYEINVDVLAPDLHKQLPHQLGAIVNINDQDLHFQNVQGYISGLDLFLDKPWDDKIEIKNYKTKFEDLFTTIVASTEEMHKNEYITGVVSQVFSSANQINENVIKNSMLKADLNYQFNNGKLTIDEANGIWGTSDLGVVAFRGGGIFTATEKDAQGNWYWNTGIIPTGINADLITTGQLDTNLVRIFAGDKVKLQLNADGLIAYKSILDDDEFKLGLSHLQTNPEEKRADTWLEKLKANNLDMKQYVVHNDQGLFLRAEENAIVLKKDEQGDEQLHELTFAQDEKNKYIDRVAITWDGLTLRNWDNEKTLWAEADTGDLTVKGNIQATSLKIVRPDGSTDVPEDGVDFVLSTENYYKYVNDNAIRPKYPDDPASALYNVNIVEQPHSIYSVVGDTISFSVKLKSNLLETVSYQWQNRSLTTANAQWANSTRPGNNTAKVTSAVVNDSYNYEWRCAITIPNQSTFYTRSVRIYDAESKVNEDGWYLTAAAAKAHAGTDDLYYWTCTKTVYAYAGATYEYTSGTDVYEKYLTNNLKNLQDTIDNNIILLQNQIDGEIDTWFYQATPAPVTVAAYQQNKRIIPSDLETEWGLTWNSEANDYTEAAKVIIARHISDIYYDVSAPSSNNTAGHAWRFIVNTSNNKISNYYWQEISDTTMVKTLQLASQAKDTADSKIRTFYDSIEPGSAGSTITGPFDDGDLWINSADDNNTLYRYNGSAWEEVRDAGIEDALTTANSAYSVADAAKTKADDIYDGTLGLYFPKDSDNEIYSLTLNTASGLIIKGQKLDVTDPYNPKWLNTSFRVNNTAMGFFDDTIADSPKMLLGYSNGSLLLRDSLLVDNGDSYFGPAGLKLGTVLDITQDKKKNYVLQQFVLASGGDNSVELISLKPITSKDENGDDITTYKLHLDETILPDREEYMRWLTIGNAITTGHSYYVTDSDQLPANASIGSLGFVYPSTLTSSSSSSSPAPTLSATVVTEAPPAINNHIYSADESEYKYKTFFGMYGLYWNVNQGGNNDPPAVDIENLKVINNYARAGHGGSVILCYAIAPLKVELKNLSDTNATYSTNELTVTFKYRYNYANHIWDAPNNTWTHSRQITGYLIKASSYTGTSYTILSKTTISLNTSVLITSSTPLDGSANFSFSLTQFSNNDILYFVVGDDQDQTWRVTKNPKHTGERRLNESYSGTQNCIYVCTQGKDAPTIGDTTAAESTTTYTVGAYIKSVYGWDSLSTVSSGGNSGNSSTIKANAPLRLSNSNALSLIRNINGGLTVEDSGLKINLSDTLSGLKLEDNVLKINCGEGLTIDQDTGQLKVNGSGNSGGSGTTYTNGNGISISGNAISVNYNTDRLTLDTNDKLTVSLNASGGLTSSSGLKIKLDGDSLTLTSAGLKVTNPSSSSITAGYGLALNSGSMSINTSASQGLVANSSGLSIKLAADSGLTLASDGLKVTGSSSSSNVTNVSAGNGLALSGSTMSVKLASNSGLSVDTNGLKVASTIPGPLTILSSTSNAQFNLKSSATNGAIFNYTLYSDLVEIKLSDSSGTSEYIMIKGFLPSAVSSNNSTYNNFLELHYKLTGDTYDTTYRMLHSGMYTGSTAHPTISDDEWQEVKWYYNQKWKYMCFARAQ